ncbi:MAG: hypothetical protein ACLTFJ_11920 [Clostridium sp.]
MYFRQPVPDPGAFLRVKAIALPEDAEFCRRFSLGKGYLDSEIYELYRKNGISSLAISGLHVSIVGLGIWKIFRKGGAGFWISGIFAGISLRLRHDGGQRRVLWPGRCQWQGSLSAAAVGRTYDLPTAMYSGGRIAVPSVSAVPGVLSAVLAVTSLTIPAGFFHGEKLYG